MPRMGGPELVEKLKQKRNDFVVIFMSGYTEAAALENAKIGAEAILLNKPFSAELLVRRISEVRQRSNDVPRQHNNKDRAAVVLMSFPDGKTHLMPENVTRRCRGTDKERQRWSRVKLSNDGHLPWPIDE
jgi:FixJ family two-component response regulator